MPVNREAIEETLDFMDGLHPGQFNMLTYGEHAGCGTVACIAGWRYVMDHSEGALPDASSMGVYLHARDAFGLTDVQAQSVFLAVIDSVAALRRFVECHLYEDDWGTG